ncbi:hypothetical protein BX666DRAFT_2113625 [Dichotomocladium elegans]|nr:hypothetical protein BX666DRAFT_2113625 [Dichotomocladium elegans]
MFLFRRYILGLWLMPGKLPVGLSFYVQLELFVCLLPVAAGYVIGILTSREASKSLRASERIIVSSEGSESLCFIDLLVTCFVKMNMDGHHVHTSLIKASLH